MQDRNHLTVIVTVGVVLFVFGLLFTLVSNTNRILNEREKQAAFTAGYQKATAYWTAPMCRVNDDVNMSIDR